MKKNWIVFLPLLIFSCGGGGSTTEGCEFLVTVSGPLNETFDRSSEKTYGCSSSGHSDDSQLTAFHSAPTSGKEIQSVYFTYTGLQKGNTTTNFSVVVWISDGFENVWKSLDGDCGLNLTSNSQTVDGEGYLQSTLGTGNISCSMPLAPYGNNALAPLTLSQMKFTGLIPY